MQVCVTFERGHYSLRENESVLDALVRGGADVSFSCRRGTCHVCMLRASEGDPGPEAQRQLPEASRARGYFLPCKAHPTSDLRVERIDRSALFMRARIADKKRLSPQIVQLLLEPESQLPVRAGQFVNLAARGVVRPYSVANLAELDHFVELHVQRMAGGTVSQYLHDEATIGDEVELQGPNGRCHYHVAMQGRPLLLIGTGSGLAPLWGILQDALYHEHRGPIHLYHGASSESGLYLRQELATLVERHTHVTYTACVPGSATGTVVNGAVHEVAFAQNPDLSETELFLAGAPGMVYDARYRALLAGAAPQRLHSDPFESAAPYTPNDTAKMAAIPPDPELWEALERGPGLTRILTDFYGVAFQDPRLAPFFHNVTKQRAIEKQFEFLREIFARDVDFFGYKPFNAHHWMVISDELFDYRERLIEAAMERYGLAKHLIQRWLAIHELFRREIVKSEARGLIVDGVERKLSGYSEETLEVGSMCDGCGAEMPVGARGRMHQRTGKLFCEGCAPTRPRAHATDDSD